MTRRSASGNYVLSLEDHPYLSLHSTYGINGKAYKELYAKQGKACAICKKPGDPTKRLPLAVDHCHKTGIVRGLLCQKCNTGLGQFNDDPDILFEAVEYLERPRAPRFFHYKFRHLRNRNA